MEQILVDQQNFYRLKENKSPSSVLSLFVESVVPVPGNLVAQQLYFYSVAPDGSAEFVMTPVGRPNQFLDVQMTLSGQVKILQDFGCFDVSDDVVWEAISPDNEKTDHVRVFPPFTSASRSLCCVCLFFSLSISYLSVSHTEDSCVVEIVCCSHGPCCNHQYVSASVHMCCSEAGNFEYSCCAGALVCVCVCVCLCVFQPLVVVLCVVFVAFASTLVCRF